jgi:hypothetical protein
MVYPDLFRVGELLMGLTTESEIQESYLIRCFVHNNTDINKESILNKIQFESHTNT